ncbi:M14/M99 family metallopeptidase [Desulfurobacterium atlanticum]|uniref:Carboxypeptidase controlling helical cell shape n=1 Tax=Desulfurobacterium atlanticum TaxID=240169 RepID=A0A238YW29_9BACT|nr:M14/M99 family metallopeptidase [Desulfurobacterium atlanticum]SNR75260.1 Carboxypeptidase controlling helical cell shape [Desulfurobacterium atlanticum]
MKDIKLGKLIKVVFFFVVPLLFSATLHLPSYVPKTYEKKITNSPKAFVISGAHGDEIGGYLSAVYLYKTLKVKNGDIKFLPFLNIKSVVKTYRYLDGVGDINDKFSFSKQNVLNLPDNVFRKIEFIRKEIRDFKPDVVLSLHVAWGYSVINKKRWGNSIVIDEKRYKNLILYPVAKKVLQSINSNNKYRYRDYSIKVLNTFSKNVKSEMNDFSAWVLKSGFPVYTIESSKQLDLWRQIYNTSFAVAEFLKFYGFKIENLDTVLNKRQIDKFLKSIKKRKVKLKFLIDGKYYTYDCEYRGKLIVPVKKDSEIFIPEVEINDIGYFIVPRSEMNYKKNYFFRNFINFKVKYLNVSKKRYDDYCYIRFVVK